VRQIITVLVAVLGASLVLAAAAGAKDGDVLRAGTCTQASTSKLKLGPEDGGIEVEFEVDQNRNGVRWKVVVVRNGSVVASRTRVTRGPSGSFELELVTRNVSGTDRFVARATRAGETCTARAAIA
jgi:hypothetical protein